MGLVDLHLDVLRREGSNMRQYSEEYNEAFTQLFSLIDAAYTEDSVGDAAVQAKQTFETYRRKFEAFAAVINKFSNWATTFAGSMEDTDNSNASNFKRNEL